MTKEMELMARLESLKMFALVTRDKVLEMQLYDNSGLLGESMRESMMNEIESRIEFTDEQIMIVFVELRELTA